MAKFSYSEGLAEYHKRSDTLEKTCQFIQDNRDWLNVNNIKSILSIGSGSGEVDKCIIDKSPHLERYTGIEPDRELCSLLRQNLGTCKSLCEFEVVNKQMESFCIDNRHFDFILLAQVIYYVQNKAAYLRELVNALTESGIIILTIASPIFGDMIENPRIPQRKYTVQELEEDLGKAGILDFETKTIKVELNFQDAPDQLINLFYLRGTTENERQGWRQWVMDEFGGIFDNQSITVYKIKRS